MNWSFYASALLLSFGVGYGYASFLQHRGVIKNLQSIIVFIRSFSIKR